MDREELKIRLAPFIQKCKEMGRPLSDICLEEAYPGDKSTSYIVKVKADWVDDMSCSAALDFLFDVLFETVDRMTRVSIFSIYVLDSKEELHCVSEGKIK